MDNKIGEAVSRFAEFVARRYIAEEADTSMPICPDLYPEQLQKAINEIHKAYTDCVAKELGKTKGQPDYKMLCDDWNRCKEQTLSNMNKLIGGNDD